MADWIYQNAIASNSVRQSMEESMQRRIMKLRTYAAIWIAIPVITAGMAAISSARADEAQARSLFKAMSDYVAAQNAISLEYDSFLEIVTRENQKLGLASSGTITLNRPDKIRATRVGGFANTELVFDGQMVTLLGKNLNLYAQVEAPGSIDKLVDVLRDRYLRPLPAADLLMSNPYDRLMPHVKDVKDLRSGVIRGVECDHLAFRTDDVDWQIWIAQGARPYPCRYVITTTKILGAPQYTVDVRTWRTGGDAGSDSFKAEIPPGARKLVPAELADFNELPNAFSR
jgi:hypothetical protein